MIKNEELDLLIELVLLYKRYGSNVFENLQKFIRSGEFNTIFNNSLDYNKLDALSTLLLRNELINLNILNKSKIYIKTKLESIKESQSEKYNILLNIYNAAKIKNILPTRRDAIEVADDLGLYIPKNATRESIISKIINYFIELPGDTFKNKLDKILIKKKQESTLESWANIILKPKDEQY